jgi:hypothetical protein
MGSCLKNTTNLLPPKFMQSRLKPKIHIHEEQRGASKPSNSFFTEKPHPEFERQQ